MKDFDGFRPKYHEVHGGLPQVERFVIRSSDTIKEGAAVNVTSGYVEMLDATNENFYGYCVGFEDADGFTYAQKTSGFTGTYTENAQGDTYVASATNDDSGGDNCVALVIPAPGVVCSAKLDAARGTTTGSNLPGYYLDILTTNAQQLDESSASTTKAQFRIVPGKPGERTATDPEHPDTTTRIMVIGVELQQYENQ